MIDDAFGAERIYSPVYMRTPTTSDLQMFQQLTYVARAQPVSTSFRPKRALQSSLRSYSRNWKTRLVVLLSSGAQRFIGRYDNLYRKRSFGHCQ